ncbi:winged helix-turn-helix domain-containing protein [Marivirga arenosa]|jgi:DNA-binding MarR family transcriptional regulator|uniref:Transcriptional regulator n=1 Tax=Marivirga arenosa TaxID=3059076 RepID=A0AA49GGJ5_9BACT|nr:MULTISPECIES: transcriptional regulator [unclassified Marivirga]WKK87272.1 transcriptional regulator [Marivirga sp. ABR2-2]WNB18367.1 transcriptional regulator [Marivirga sp. BKB1-2]
MFEPLDPLLHSQLRLAIMSLLMNLEEADFNYIKEKTGATAGNLSVQVNKLKDANYIKVEKSFKDNYPHTSCSITEKGVDAFESYLNALRSYIKPTD